MVTITLSQAAAAELQARAQRVSDASGVSVTPTQIAAGLLLGALGFRPDGSPRVDTAAEQVSHAHPNEHTTVDALPAPLGAEPGGPLDKRGAPTAARKPVTSTNAARARADAKRPTRATKGAPKGGKKA